MVLASLAAARRTRAVAAGLWLLNAADHFDTQTKMHTHLLRVLDASGFAYVAVSLDALSYHCSSLAAPASVFCHAVGRENLILRRTAIPLCDALAQTYFGK